MGKLKGIVQFTGKFDGLSFYEMNGKIVIRKTGGFDGEKFKNSANYARVRENSSEFAHCAKVGKYFRSAIAACLLPLRIPYVHNHIVSLFQEILKLDEIQNRGNRTVRNGMLTAEGKKALLAFEFDKTQKFSRYFPFKMEVDFTAGSLKFLDFCASTLITPKGADQIQLQLHVAKLDFEHFTTPITQTSSIALIDLNDATIYDLVLSFTPTLQDSNFYVAVLEVCFLQEVNGSFVKLKGGGLKIVGVH
ncbi:MAG: hypothetical protein LDL23_11560 [Flavobacterium sp.]|uniref:hypothetical protein n=1 Tax=Flavobacterium sp. TaxID=239 RepID=UPI0025C05822|nr:hypothetical protein [Flavobacterium sp.]MCA1967269.1 hypothetical protein [Flavobacterium sp.]